MRAEQTGDSEMIRFKLPRFFRDFSDFTQRNALKFFVCHDIYLNSKLEASLGVDPKRDTSNRLVFLGNTHM